MRGNFVAYLWLDIFPAALSTRIYEEAKKGNGAKENKKQLSTSLPNCSNE